MKIYSSEMAIPELENVPCKEARRIWRRFYFHNRDWFNLSYLICPLGAGLGAGIGAYFEIETIISGLLGASLGFEIHRQIMIDHLRPKIRSYLKNHEPRLE
ncbi:MAG: hypothetical protein HY298_07540 [Verrucomicrobia bacterium]|nr:hypothetical protein [Verrucomicrobiota bacterium]